MQQTTEQRQMIQGKSSERAHTQNMQLDSAGDLKNWDKAIGPRSLLAAERCRKRPQAEQQARMTCGLV
jgi:hypothetical protein